MNDNVIPFRRPNRKPSGSNDKSRARPLPAGPRASPPEVSRVPQPTVRKAPVRARDIELSKRLAAVTFLPQEEFLRSIGDRGESLRRVALMREVDLLGSVMASNDRVFVLGSITPKNVETLYRHCRRLKAALDALTGEFGRASLYNLGSFAVTFDPIQPSGWHEVRRGEEQLRLNEEFTEQEVTDLVRPRLKPADRYEHEIFDVSHRNV